MAVIEKDAVASVHYTGTLPESGESLIPVKVETH